MSVTLRYRIEIVILAPVLLDGGFCRDWTASLFAPELPPEEQHEEGPHRHHRIPTDPARWVSVLPMI